MKNISSICVNEAITTLCIGKFDGVHIAHQALFSRMDLQSGGVLIIGSNPPFLTPNKKELIPFVSYEVPLVEIKEKNHQEFASFLLSFFPNLQKIIVGYDFRFGKNRAYSPKDLEDFFEVCVIEEIAINHIAVHKQRILQALQEGEIDLANAMLGRTYSLQGKVIQGQGLGSKECVATLNLAVHHYVLPKEGVYATITKIAGVEYQSVSFIGHRLSSDGNFAIETHLLGRCLDCSPKEVEIFFLAFLRENQRFSSLALLKEQIKSDILEAKARFAEL